MKSLASCDAFAEVSGLKSEEIECRNSLQAELLSIYRIEERSNTQNSKLHWLKVGDENSGFFHRFLSAQKRKNLITELVDDFGAATRSFHEIEGLILSFYKSLYKGCQV